MEFPKAYLPVTVLSVVPSFEGQPYIHMSSRIEKIAVMFISMSSEINPLRTQTLGFKTPYATPCSSDGCQAPTTGSVRTKNCAKTLPMQITFYW